MKVEIFNKSTNSTQTIHNVRGISVEGFPGDMLGGLVIFQSFTNDDKVHHIPRFEWNRLLVTKDFAEEKV